MYCWGRNISHNNPTCIYLHILQVMNKSTMDDHFDFVSVVKPNIVALKILGFWRSLKPNSVFNTVWYNSYTATVVSLQFFFEGVGFMFLYDKWENLSLLDINSVIFIYSTGLLNLMMMILVYFKIESVHFIQSEMQSRVFQPKSQSQAECARKWKGVARLFQKLFFSNNLFNNIAVILLAVLKGERFILAAHKPSVVHWKVFFVFQAIMCTYSGHMCTVYATLFIAVMVEVIIQLNLIEETLKSTTDRDQLKKCVEWHLQVLVFFKKVQSLCGVGISSILSCGILNMCTSMSLVLQVQNTDMLFILPYIIVILTAMYTQCWCGSEIVDQSEKTAYAIYSSNWVDGDLSYKKLIIMYISLTMKPLAIRLGGGITIATLPVFVTIIKSTYSAFTILQTFQ